MTFETEIERAKNCLKDYMGYSDREYVKSAIRSYDNKEYDVDVYVLPGSPVKGTIIVNHGIQDIKIFDAHNEKIKFKVKL